MKGSMDYDSKITNEIIFEHEGRIKALEKIYLKYRVLLEMSNIVEKAEKEYNALRQWAGERYPKGKCKNILNLFEILHEIVQ